MWEGPGEMGTGHRYRVAPGNRVPVTLRGGLAKDLKKGYFAAGAES